MLRISVALVALVLSATLPAQITQIAGAQLIAPTMLNFDTAPVGLISNTDNYFILFGLASVSIINDPGLHTVGTDTLSSGVTGNCLASNGNSLAIVAPAGPLDDHQAGAGWSFRLAGGTFATQFGCVVADQVNHQMVVETWCLGTRRNTFTFTMTGGFPNPPIYFEDLAGFDEVRFMNPVANGGWGIDDFTLGNVQAGSCPACNFEGNTPEARHTFNNVVGSCAGAATLTVPGGTSVVSSLNANGVGTIFEQVFAAGPAIPRSLQAPVATTATQTVNLDFTAILFYMGGAILGVPSQFNPQALSPAGFTLPIPTPVVLVPVTLTHQAIVFDPTAPEGFYLTQASQLTIN